MLSRFVEHPITGKLFPLSSEIGKSILKEYLINNTLSGGADGTSLTSEDEFLRNYMLTDDRYLIKLSLSLMVKNLMNDVEFDFDEGLKICLDNNIITLEEDLLSCISANNTNIYNTFSFSTWHHDIAGEPCFYDVDKEAECFYKIFKNSLFCNNLILDGSIDRCVFIA